jgi:hypothetical protein
MSDLSSQNLDVIAAEVAYRHRVSVVADDHELTRAHRWIRRHRKAADRAA